MEANSVLLQKKYVRIVALFAEQMQLTLDEALEFFYRSETYQELPLMRRWSFSIVQKPIRNCAMELPICTVEAISIL